jgi:hypothetical protein
MSGGLSVEARKIICDYWEDGNMSKTCVKNTVKMCYTEMYSDVRGTTKSSLHVPHLHLDIWCQNEVIRENSVTCFSN